MADELPDRVTRLEVQQSGVQDRLGSIDSLIKDHEMRLRSVEKSNVRLTVLVGSAAISGSVAGSMLIRFLFG